MNERYDVVDINRHAKVSRCLETQSYLNPPADEHEAWHDWLKDNHYWFLANPNGFNLFSDPDHRFRNQVVVRQVLPL